MVVVAVSCGGRGTVRVWAPKWGRGMLEGTALAAAAVPTFGVSGGATASLRIQPLVVEHGRIVGYFILAEEKVREL